MQSRSSILAAVLALWTLCGLAASVDGSDTTSRLPRAAASGGHPVREAPALDVEPGQVLALELSHEALARARAMGFREAGEETLRGLAIRITRLSTPAGMTGTLALNRLRSADPAGSYDVNARYVPAGEPCEGLRCSGQRLVAWPESGCPQAVRVGMIDSAINEASPALAGSRIHQQHFGKVRARAAGAEHGTAIATLFAGQPQAGFQGLLPNASLLAADVFDYAATEHGTTNALLIARGLEWLLAQQPAVINISLAGPDNLLLHEAVSRVTAQGVPVVAAAGNLGPAASPRYPAAYLESIAVTAVDLAGRASELANSGPWVDVAGPGLHIWSAGANGQGRYFDGTSFAAPYVSAEVALQRSVDPGRSPREWKLMLHSPADGPQSTVGMLRSRGCGPAGLQPPPR